MKYIKQFRYYGTGSRADNNYPSYSSPTAFLTALTQGNIFQDYGSITKLGIQCRPNTHFRLNDSIHDIVIGETGIYELDLEGFGHIFKIQFNASDLRIFDQPGVTDRLLIDIVYEGSGVSE